VSARKTEKKKGVVGRTAGWFIPEEGTS